jgi:hypothetical protein
VAVNTADIKLKDNIVDCTSKLFEINSLRVINYNMISDPDEHKHIGFLAQEFEQVFPSMVEDTIDRDSEGIDLGTVTKGIKWSPLVPILVKALQELDVKHSTLQFAPRSCVCIRIELILLRNSVNPRYVTTNSTIKV